MCKKSIIVALTLSVTLSITPGQHKHTLSPAQSKTFKHRGMSIEVRIAKADISNKPWQGFWGAAERRGSTLVSSIDISYQQTKISAPRSAFADLANAHTFASMPNGKQLIVTIEGGDAADGYKAALYFESGDIIKRVVKSGEFPRNRWEETKYVKLPVND